MDNALRDVQASACAAWALPADSTCASVARRTFRQIASGLGLGAAVTDDGVTMVSELAANTLHAQREQRRRELLADSPELWVYLRDCGQRRELVCKIFDAFPGWLRGNAPGRGQRRAPADAMSGRGLEVVHELSQGRWGYHLTRARLGGGQVRGKAVWFAVPAKTTVVTGARRGRMPAGAAMTEFEEALAARGLSSDHWSYCDLVEVAERAVEAYESLAAAGAEPPRLADATRCGCLRHRR